MTDDGPPITTDCLPADRSLLEDYADCPRLGRAKELKLVADNSDPAEIGNEVHRTISSAITEYVSSQGMMNVTELIDFMRGEIAASRPDVQPKAIAALRPSLWGIARLIRDRHFLNILRFDGGEGDKSGQLSHDYPDFKVRATSELDFVFSDPRATSIIREVDWKSGHEYYTASKISQSFQFDFHALLLFKNYPDVQTVEVQVYMTLFNSLTPPVQFIRERDLFDLDWRVRRAAAQFAKARGKTAYECDAWPMVEKCGACPFAARCDASGLPEDTPDQIVDKLAILQTRIDALETLAERHVGLLGHDIITPSGQCYGLEKPKKKVKARMAFYTAGKQKSETTTGEGE